MNNFWKIVIGAAAAAIASYAVSAGVKNSRLKKSQTNSGGEAVEKSSPAAVPKPEILDKRPGHKLCSGCGEKVAEYDFFCPACGSPMDQVAAAGDRAENRV